MVSPGSLLMTSEYESRFQEDKSSSLILGLFRDGDVRGVEHIDRAVCSSLQG